MMDKSSFIFLLKWTAACSTLFSVGCFAIDLNDYRFIHQAKGVGTILGTVHITKNNIHSKPVSLALIQQKLCELPK